MDKTRAKDVLPNINRMQAATSVLSHHPLAATEWSHLLLHDVVCSERITIHFQWGGNLFLVTLTFDLDTQ